jgi:hypothetical protein
MTLISRKDFAELCGISKQAVAKMVKNGKLPITRDGLIDTGTDECLVYMKSKRVDISALAMRDPGPVSSSVSSAPPPRGARAQIPAGQVVGRQALELAKLEADTDYRRLQAAKLEGEMVSRDVFERRIWGPSETFCQRILSDGAKTITAKAVQMARSGYVKSDTGEEFTEAAIEETVRNEISTHIKAFVAAMTRSKQKEMK